MCCRATRPPRSNTSRYCRPRRRLRPRVTYRWVAGALPHRGVRDQHAAAESGGGVTARGPKPRGRCRPAARDRSPGPHQYCGRSVARSRSSVGPMLREQRFGAAQREVAHERRWTGADRHQRRDALKRRGKLGILRDGDAVMTGGHQRSSTGLHLGVAPARAGHGYGAAQTDPHRDVGVRRLRRRHAPTTPTGCTPPRSASPRRTAPADRNRRAGVDVPVEAGRAAARGDLARVALRRRGLVAGRRANGNRRERLVALSLSPFGPGGPCGIWPGPKSRVSSEPSATCDVPIAFLARSARFTSPSLIVLDTTLLFASLTTA